MTIEKRIARIENEETKECSVFMGEETPDNVHWAIETCGMSLLEVEKSESGVYYIAGFCPPPKEKNYKEKRAENYPDLKEQLGLLFHDIEKGFLGEKAKESDFYLALKEVKEKFPKVEEQEEKL